LLLDCNLFGKICEIIKHTVVASVAWQHSLLQKSLQIASHTFAMTKRLSQSLIWQFFQWFEVCFVTDCFKTSI